MGRIKQQRVTLGERLGDNVAITEPLPDDSQVVKQGGSFLNDGDLVRLITVTGLTNNQADTTTNNSTGTATQARV